MAESSSTGHQLAVTVLKCALCRVSFTAYHDLRCHIISTHKRLKVPSAAPPSSIIDSSAAIEDEIQPKSPKINKRNQRDQESGLLDLRGGAVTEQEAAVTPHIQCATCGFEFPSLEDLQSHIEIALPPIPSTVVIPASPAAAAAIQQQGAAAKSSVTMSQSTEMAPSTKRPKRKQKCQPFHSYQRGEFFIRGGYKEIPKFLQSQRKSRGNYFRCAYAYKDVCSDGWDKIFEKRFIVVSGGEKILQQHVFPDVEGSHGITWIGVHGINSICAVYFNRKPDRKCVVDWLRNSPLSSYFTDYVLSEMEDVADSPPYLEKILKEPTVDSSPYSQKTLKPFAVVSLPDSSISDKKSCPEFSAPSLKGQKEAIAHLKNELIGHSAFSMLQTQQVCCLYEENCGRDYELGNLSVAKVNRCLETMNQSGKNEIEDQI